MQTSLTRYQYAFLFAMIALSAWLRIGSVFFSYYHPDEVIAVKVVEHVIGSKSLNTNWALTEVPAHFKYSQYNFSGYHLFSAAYVLLVNQIPNLKAFSTLKKLRFLSAVLGSLVVLLTFLLARQWFEIKEGLLASLLVAVNPLLYQDSLYARPETFSTCLFLMMLLFIQRPERYLRKSAFVILGILIGTKVSFIFFAPLLFLTEKRFSFLMPTAKKALISIFLVSLGFLLAAPFTAIFPFEYSFGIWRLNHQYNEMNWPHGLPHGTIWQRLAYSAQYFFLTTGWPTLLLSLIGIWINRRRKQLVFVFIWFLLFAVRFSTYAVFFERNFSHLLPSLLILSASTYFWMWHHILNLKTQVIYGPITLFLIFYYPIRTTSLIRFDEVSGHRKERLDRIRLETENQFHLRSEKYNQQTACQPILLEVDSDRCELTQKYLRFLKEKEGFSEVAHLKSNFENVPPCTLHNYFVPETFFYFRPAAPEKCVESKNLKR